MKPILCAILGTFAIAGVAWVALTLFANAPSPAIRNRVGANPSAGEEFREIGKPATPTAGHDVSTDEHHPFSSASRPGQATQPQSSLLQSATPAARAVKEPEHSFVAAPSRPGPAATQTARNSGGEPADSGPGAPGSLIGTQSSGPWPATGSQESVLEVEPGVPLPAALVPQEASVQQTPQSAAAQQQIADSFAQKMDTALNQQPQSPASDAAVQESYYEALDQANEQFRSLYGNDSYNASTMKASFDAMQ